MTKGIIYIFTNDSMPDLIKIGRTTDLERRLRELDNTSIPLPFRCHYAIEVEDYETKEKLIHDALSDHRVRYNREFFKLAPERVVSILKAISCKEIKFENNEMIDEGGKIFDNSKLIRKPRFRFSSINIPVGTEICFTRDNTKKAKVLSNNKVEYEENQYSLSALALKFLKELGYTWSQVQGPAYFEYNGEILSEIKPPNENDIADEE